MKLRYHRDGHCVRAQIKSSKFCPHRVKVAENYSKSEVKILVSTE